MDRLCLSEVTSSVSAVNAQRIMRVEMSPNLLFLLSTQTKTGKLAREYGTCGGHSRQKKKRICSFLPDRVCHSLLPTARGFGLKGWSFKNKRRTVTPNPASEERGNLCRKKNAGQRGQQANVGLVGCTACEHVYVV